jgi:hypothetical protein
MAKLAARPKRRHRTADEKAADSSLQTWESEPRPLLRAMRSAGVSPERAPEEALEDFIDSRKPPPERKPRPRNNRRLHGAAYHAWLLEKE